MRLQLLTRPVTTPTPTHFGFSMVFFVFFGGGGGGVNSKILVGLLPIEVKHVIGVLPSR